MTKGSADRERVVVKKYANRRLYDTSSSSYINLERIAEMLRDGLDVQVVEAKGGADVTRQVLTQIIVEGSKESGGPPTEFLKDLVRAGDRAQRDFLHWYLSSAAQVYRRLRDGWERAYRLTPAGRLTEQLQKSWDPNTVVPALMRGLTPFLDDSHRRSSDGSKRSWRPTPTEVDENSDAASSDTASSDTAEQLAALRRQLEALEKKVGG